MIGLDLLGAYDFGHARRADCPPLTHCTDPVGPVLGGYDMAAESRQMNKLKDVPVCVAKALASGGLKAIDSAITSGRAANLPGDQTRVNVQARLRDHANALASMTDPAANYPGGQQLKQDVVRAYLEWNAVEEGRGWKNQNTIAKAVGESWTETWLAIQQAAQALPEGARKIVDGAVRGVTGLPLWAWGLIGAGTLGLVGFAAFKILHAAAPAVGRVAAERYFPPGPGSLVRR